MKDNDFTPAEGVTIDNCLRYIAAIEEATRRDIALVKKSDRSMTLGLVSSALSNAADSISKLRKDMEEKGQAPPITTEQKIMARILFRLALGKDAEIN